MKSDKVRPTEMVPWVKFQTVFLKFSGVVRWADQLGNDFVLLPRPGHAGGRPAVAIPPTVGFESKKHLKKSIALKR